MAPSRGVAWRGVAWRGVARRGAASLDTAVTCWLSAGHHGTNRLKRTPHKRQIECLNPSGGRPVLPASRFGPAGARLSQAVGSCLFVCLSAGDGRLLLRYTWTCMHSPPRPSRVLAAS